MSIECLPRLLVVDNDAQVRSDLKKILEPLNYDVKVVVGDGEDLISQANICSLEFQPHIAIIDLRLLSDDSTSDQSGLRLLRNLRADGCILYSAYLTPEVMRQALHRFNARTWVSKGESPQRLVDEVARIANEKSACKRGFTIEWPVGWDSDRVAKILLGENGPSKLADDLLSQLFPEISSIHLESIDGAAVTPASISRSNSVVFKVWLQDKFEPMIVKLAPVQQIELEAKKYNEYIHGNLGGRFHASMEGNVTKFWSLGGILYSYVGERQDDLMSFAQFYKKKQKPKEITGPLHHFFKKVWRNFYEDAGKLEGSLFESYDSFLGFRERIESLNQAGKVYFPHLNLSLPNPAPWILRHERNSKLPRVRRATTHGDLHGDNLFVNHEYAWAIDFGRTGPGHILRDFVELEVDILTRLVHVPENKLSDWFVLSLALMESSNVRKPLSMKASLPKNIEIKKAFGVIGELRKIAHEVTNYKDIRELYWGLLIDSLFVATRSSTDAFRKEKALLLASVICTRLGKFSTWPPEEWLTEVL